MGDVATIPADRPFAATLAAGLLARFGARDLARVRLLLPSRRACLRLQDAFLDANDGRALLLPRLLPVGDVAEDQGLLDAAVEWRVPPAMGELERRFVLFELVRRVDAALPHEQAFRLADALAGLMDELADEGVDLVRLTELDVADVAEHWRDIAKFLELLARQWPAIAAGMGVVARREQRRRLLAAVARSWREAPPGPVVLAGVTGSVPAVAELIAAVADLPEGLVVLPGATSPGDGGLGPTHPQWGFRRLLQRLGRADVALPAWPEGAGPPSPRRQLLEAMVAPAAAPVTDVDLDAALAGITVIEAPDVASEALAVTLELRRVLEGEGRALVVAPDRQLARRVAAELARWGLVVEDSAGQPLDQTAPGVLALLVAHACLDAEPLVPALAMLGHPLARAATDAATCRRRARRLELRLRRGLEAAPGWAGLAAAAAAEGGATAAWFAGIEAVTARLRGFRGAPAVPLADLVEALVAVLDAVARDEAGGDGELWAGVTGVALADFLSELRAACGDTRPIAADAFAPILASAMAAQAVRRMQAGHPQIEIVGRFEARLAAADLVVLAGLNEGGWLPQPDAGPWLGRRQRDELGLPPPEQHVGFAVHDFIQLAAPAPRLVLTRSERDSAGAPTRRARLLDQLDRALERRSAGRRAAPSPALGWARMFDRSPRPPRPWPRPRPTPPLAARPDRLSVSDVERLIHNPYAVYAERILGLRPLDPLDRTVDARDRGTLVHRALDSFAQAHPDALPDDVAAAIVAAAAPILDPERLGEAVVALWLPRLRRIAAWLAQTEPERRAGRVRVLSERPLEATLELRTGFVRVRGRLDRLDVGPDGGAALYDYKTGTPPRRTEVEAGDRPQLPLLGWLVEQSTLDGLTPVVERLVYLELKGGEPAGRDLAVGEPAGPLVAETVAGLARLLQAYADPAVPYLAVPRPAASAFPDPFAPLARDQEWLDAEARG